MKLQLFLEKKRRQKRELVRHSVRCCPGDHYRREHRRQGRDPRHHHCRRDGLIKERLNHRAVKGLWTFI